ncbi:hypothetical protein [Beijerinckia sp. L45]|uniref:hypothetical protein n=1 Tax=Beijerinckia sp. L45 TaxID=1641855 RepID=UPI00131AB67F|nr:hypothetical protein [Beijerinckia sp. L45]
MKTLLAGLLLVTVVPAAAAPLDAYLSARDRDIAAANREKAPLSEKAEALARKTLERELKRVVPPFTAPGFKPEAKSNIASLTREQGFGQLDGIVYTSKDDKTSVLVTTRPLFAAWLKVHAAPDAGALPQTIEAALQADGLYTQAISTDAAVDKYADIPVARPAEAGFATAMLDLRRQDIARDMPNEIFAAVIRGDNVFIASQPVAMVLKPIAACEAVFDTAQTKADAAMADYQAHHVGDDAIFAAAQKLSNDGDVAHRRCIAEKLKDEAGYKPLLSQAQTLVDLLK